MQEEPRPSTDNSPIVSPSSPSAERGKSSRLLTVGLTAAAVIGVAACGVGVAASRASAQARNAGKIAPGVKIADVSVGGLTPEQATKKLREWARAKSRQPVTLVAPVSGKTWNLTLAEAGGRFDVAPAVTEAAKVGKDDTFWEMMVYGNRERNVTVEVPFSFNDSQLEKRLQAIAKSVRKPARNARVKLLDNGQIELAAHERKGVKLDVAATKTAVLREGKDALRDGAKAKLVIQEELPAVTGDDLGKLHTPLASFFTTYNSSSSNRRHNVELAAAKINGTLLAPGEVFSYNDIVGPREPYLGWRNAPTYQDGQVVPGPGGGVCQVSTTLYNAVLRANLKVVSRRNHSMPVHYVNPGSDATVSYGSIDFKFENSTGGPLLVSARAKGGKLTFTLLGSEVKDQKIQVVTGPRRGNASGGFTVTTYLVVEDVNGNKSRRALSTDSYRPMHKATATRRTRRTASRRPRARKPAASAVSPAVAPTVAQTPV